MIGKLTTASLHLAFATQFPWLRAGRNGRAVCISHPLVSLIVQVLVFALVFWALRRKGQLASPAIRRL
jgi:hypothetical protein